LKALAITQKHIVDFNKISNLTENDKKSIYTIEQTINRYYQHILLARSSREKGHNAEQIDKEVRIDDSDAVTAIKQL